MFASFSIFDLHDCQRWLPLEGKLSPKVTDEVKKLLHQIAFHTLSPHTSGGAGVQSLLGA